MVQPFESSRASLKGIPRGIVYHYTTSRSLEAIIKSKCFWLANYTDVRGDPEELIWAFNMYNIATKRLFPEDINFDEVLPKDFYIFCTCKREDNSYLWENYADNYKGVTIGIDANNLYDYYRSSYIHLAPMDYNEEEYQQLCNDSFSHLKPIAFNAPINIPDNMLELQEVERFALLDRYPGYREYRLARDNPLGQMTLQKRTGFKKEEEVRIVHSFALQGFSKKALTINKRNKAELPFIIKNKHLIKEIIITDKCSIPLERVEYLLHKNNIEGVKVECIQL